MDKVELKEVGAFEKKALADMKANYPQYLKEIREKKEISEELDKKLTEFYDNFLNEFIESEKAA